jgi:two-component system response regulator NreC
MHSEEAYLLSFLEAGGAGYVRKASVDREVIEAIRRVLAGETYVQEDGVQTLLKKHRGDPGVQEHPGPQVLSERERTVLEQTARGFTSREIGEQLGISPHTVDSYRTRIMEKLGLEHRHQLVEYALKHRLLG